MKEVRDLIKSILREHLTPDIVYDLQANNSLSKVEEELEESDSSESESEDSLSTSQR